MSIEIREYDPCEVVGDIRYYFDDPSLSSKPTLVRRTTIIPPHLFHGTLEDVLSMAETEFEALTVPNKYEVVPHTWGITKTDETYWGKGILEEGTELVAQVDRIIPLQLPNSEAGEELADHIATYRNAGRETMLLDALPHQFVYGISALTNGTPRFYMVDIEPVFASVPELE
ncbi:MAG: hypothetical protein M3P98_03820 [bacterium]|nr:hypothetical protein [bacterium]